MIKYKFSNVVFIPEGATKLLVDGQPVRLSTIQTKLLRYFLDSSGQISSNNTIIDAVWGPGQHTHAALTMAINKLHNKLPQDCRIKNVRGHGYYFDVQYSLHEYRFKRFETILEFSPLIKRIVKFHLGLLLVICIYYISESAVNFSTLFFPKTTYSLNNIKQLFTHDYIATNGKLSPDGRFFAYQLRTQQHEEYLGLMDLQLGDTKILLPMNMSAGFQWDLIGQKIIYQSITDANCEVRLVIFNHDKSDFTEHQIIECNKGSGSLSFSWFNENEFYVNLVMSDKRKTLNNLPFHHLYSVNIQTKKITKLATAKYQGGVGFYGLEYDHFTDTLYLLQTKNFTHTDFYKFHNNTLSKLARVEHLVRKFTVSNHKLIYADLDSDLILNDPADDFSRQQQLMSARPEALNEPYLLGDRLTFRMGHGYQRTLFELSGQNLRPLHLNGFIPVNLAQYEDDLVFTSRQTGINQLYRFYVNKTDGVSGRIVKLTNLQTDEYIQHIDVAKNIFALSYVNKVDIYRYEQEQFTLLRTFKDFSRGVLNEQGDKVLLFSTHNDGKKVVLERHLYDSELIDHVVDDAVFAFYHLGHILYINDDQELLRIVNQQRQVVATNVNVTSKDRLNVAGNMLYYIDNQSENNQLKYIQLSTGERGGLNLRHYNATQVQAIGNKVYVNIILPTQAKIMISDLEKNEKKVIYDYF